MALQDHSRTLLHGVNKTVKPHIERDFKYSSGTHDKSDTKHEKPHDRAKQENELVEFFSEELHKKLLNVF